MNIILVPSQRYQDSRHILQKLTFLGASWASVIAHKDLQRFTGSNYLDVDSPLTFPNNTKKIQRRVAEICNMGKLWLKTLNTLEVMYVALLRKHYKFYKHLFF